MANFQTVDMMKSRHGVGPYLVKGPLSIVYNLSYRFMVKTGFKPPMRLASLSCSPDSRTPHMETIQYVKYYDAQLKQDTSSPCKPFFRHFPNPIEITNTLFFEAAKWFARSTVPSDIIRLWFFLCGHTMHQRAPPPVLAPMLI